MASIPGVTLTKTPLSSPPVSTSPQPPSVTSPAKKESDTALRQEGNFMLMFWLNYNEIKLLKRVRVNLWKQHESEQPGII